MPDGEGFLQRIERRTVDDVFDAGDVLGTLDAVSYTHLDVYKRQPVALFYSN